MSFALEQIMSQAFVIKVLLLFRKIATTMSSVLIGQYKLIILNPFES